MNILITGAARGIGLALCQLYHSQGHQVWATCRTASEELLAAGVNVIENIDVCAEDATAKIKQALAGNQLDVLVNNAGYLANDSVEAIDYAELDKQWQVNAVAPLRISLGLLGSLKPQAKIAFISSIMASMSNNDMGGSYGYRMSKAALNAAGKSLAVDLKEQGISVGLLHPGWVTTALTGMTGHIGPDEVALQLAERIEQISLENSGTFWHAEGEVLPW